MAKTPKIVPVIIHSVEGLQAVVADVVRQKLDRARRQAEMELEMAAVQKKHQEGILQLDRQIQTNEAGIYIFCVTRRKEIFPEKKSLDMLLATIGFREDPPSVEKVSKGDTWEDVAYRLYGLDWGKDYVTDPAPAVDKKGLLRDRKIFTAEQLAAAGIRFDQDEQFYITPKSEILEGSQQAAA